MAVGDRLVIHGLLGLRGSGVVATAHGDSRDFEVMPIEGLALIGAAVVVLTGCLKVDDGYRSIEWPILVLICSMLAVSIAMQKAG